jgi:hypothetical protein
MTGTGHLSRVPRPPCSAQVKRRTCPGARDTIPGTGAGIASQVQNLLTVSQEVLSCPQAGGMVTPPPSGA